MKKGLIIVIFTTLFVIFSPNSYSDGCDDKGTGEAVQCIKDSDGNCIEQ